MKITICSSVIFRKESYKIKKLLEEKGYEVLVYPEDVEVKGKRVAVEDYHRMKKENLTRDLVNLQAQLMDNHIKRIEQSDAILVLNFDKEGEEGRVGGNVFLEMGIARYLGKKIFLWKQPGEGSFLEEIMALQPIVIGEDVEKITQ